MKRGRSFTLIWWSVAIALVLSLVGSCAVPSGFDVCKFGAAGDGVKDDAAAINAAIAAANDAGGGTVFLCGNHAVGSQILMNRVNGVTVRGNDDYTLSPTQGFDRHIFRILHSSDVHLDRLRNDGKFGGAYKFQTAISFETDVVDFSVTRSEVFNMKYDGVHNTTNSRPDRLTRLSVSGF